jgi:hypothetical protein
MLGGFIVGVIVGIVGTLLTIFFGEDFIDFISDLFD